MSEGLITTGYALGNVASSVALVLVNKKVFAAGFHFPLCLSFFHFCFTVVFYKMLLCCNVFSLPATDLPQIEKFKVAAAGVASIAFMNVSLALNSVGFYQVTKLTIVPVTLLINYAVYNVGTTMKIKLALCILLLGVGVATVSDVQLQPLGLLFGVLAVLSTAMFQIWQGTKQKEFEMGGTQLQNSVAIWQTAQALGCTLVFEFFCYDGANPCDSALAFLQSAVAAPEGKAASTMGVVLVTCFLALAVNWCSFGLIGNTSPTTFQVIGHAKTCLVLVGGYVMFPGASDPEAMMYNIGGVSIAMVGVVLYGHLKHTSSQSKDDCLDCICPTGIARFLDNKYATVEASETEGLTKS